jgi:esterase/lipase superfamily enzyme
MGVPVLLFPTAGGDAEEVERFKMIEVLAPLLGEGRIKVYSMDSIAARHWISKDNAIHIAARVQHQFDQCIAREVVPAIRQDCGGDTTREVVAAGASIGAFNALAAICRHPEDFRTAICMSGTYDLRKFLRGEMNEDFHHASPVHFVPGLPEGPQLAALRRRFVLLTHGEGAHESPEESWNVAHVLGNRGVPNRVDSWGTDWRHDWVTWRKMLPQYLGELVK